jgi:hypothetical protein
VKLVSLKQAAQGAGFAGDIRRLGQAMLWIATNPDPVDPLNPAPFLDSAPFYGDRNHGHLQSLKFYDPSLYYLIKWMVLNPVPPTMHEVLAHPYFMTVSERKSFGLALGGGMIGACLCPNPHVNTVATREIAVFDAVGPEMKDYLDHQLGLMFETTIATAIPHPPVTPQPLVPPNPSNLAGEQQFCDGIYQLLCTCSPPSPAVFL